MPLMPNVSAAICSRAATRAAPVLRTDECSSLSSTRCHARCMRITCDQALNVSKRILFGACRSRGGLDHLSNDDIEIDKPRQRAVPNILPPHARATCPACMGESGCLRGSRPHASQFIHADRAFSLVGTPGLPWHRPDSHQRFSLPVARRQLLSTNIGSGAVRAVGSSLF